MRKAKFETLVSNIKLLRNKFKDLNIHIEFVANKENKNDIEGFIPWVFDELKADSLNIRRVAIGAYAPRSFLEESINNNVTIGLTDEEWIDIQNRVSTSWPNELSTTPSFNSEDQFLRKQATTEVIEL